VAIEIAYIPHACVSEFLQGEEGRGYANYGQMEHLQEFVPSIRCKKNHLGHIWYGFKT
jgi:hypothetical protein